MALGALANVGITGVAAACYAAAAVAAQARRRRVAGAEGAGPFLFGTIAVYLGLAALRQVAAFYSVTEPDFEDVDRGLYYLVIVPAALVIVPHVYLVSSLLWHRPGLSQKLAAGFLLVVLVGLIFGYIGGVDGPFRSDYGTDWSLRSPVTKILLVVAIMLPGLLGAAALIWVARGFGEADQRRFRLVGISALAYFLVFTLDAFGLAGIPLLSARLAMAGTGLLAWWAYRRVDVVHIPEPFRPDEAPYQR